jgi:hypothetical protein
MISNVYNCDESEQNKIFQSLKESIGIESKNEMEKDSEIKSEPSLYEVLFGKTYRKATWIIFIWTFFFNWTGIDSINMYSNIIIN